MKICMHCHCCSPRRSSRRIPTPPRPVTDPKSLTSPSDPQAAPVPIDDLVFSRGVARRGVERGRAAAVRLDQPHRPLQHLADGRRRQLAGAADQSDDNQAGFAVSPDGRTLYYTQDKGGNEQYDIYAVPTAGGAVRNLTNTPDLRESGLLMAPDGRSIAMSTKRSSEGQDNLAVHRPGDRQVRPLTHEADPQWNWSARSHGSTAAAPLIANRGFTDGSAGEVWKVDVASGKATSLLGKPDVVYTGERRDARRLGHRDHHERDTKQLHAAVYRGAAGRSGPSKPTPWEQIERRDQPGRSLDGRSDQRGRPAVARAGRSLRRSPSGRSRCRRASTRRSARSRSLRIRGACWSFIPARTAQRNCRRSISLAAE